MANKQASVFFFFLLIPSIVTQAKSESWKHMIKFDRVMTSRKLLQLGDVIEELGQIIGSEGAVVEEGGQGIAPLIDQSVSSAAEGTGVIDQSVSSAADETEAIDESGSDNELSTDGGSEKELSNERRDRGAGDSQLSNDDGSDGDTGDDDDDDNDDSSDDDDDEDDDDKKKKKKKVIAPCDLKHLLCY